MVEAENPVHYFCVLFKKHECLAKGTTLLLKKMRKLCEVFVGILIGNNCYKKFIFDLE